MERGGVSCFQGRAQGNGSNVRGLGTGPKMRTQGGMGMRMEVQGGIAKWGAGCKQEVVGGIEAQANRTWR